MPTGLLVPPDVDVDRFVADREFSVKPQVSGDLLRAPVCLQLLLHQSEVSLREALVPTRMRPPSVRSLDGFAGPVGTIPAGAISSHLS